MTGSNDGTTVAQPHSLDFDSMYQGRSSLAELYGDLTPWEIGEPQPSVIEIAESGQLAGEVLDAGCGLGDNAFFLARQGFRVTGFDAAPTAVKRATERAAAMGIDASFVVADALELTDFYGRFTTVVDSALYHCLDEESRRRYLAEVRQVLRPGGRLHLVCFSNTRVKRLSALNYISEEELRANLSDGWEITTLRPTGYVTAFTREHVARSAAKFNYDSVDEYIRCTFEVDDRGRFLCPSWLVTAVRR
jgi:SAM-dependent methyltransferase